MSSSPVRRVVGLCACLLGAALASRTAPEEPMTARADELLAALGPDLSARARFEPDDVRRVEWHYVPREWPGVRLGELAPAQREGLDRLVAAGLSERGWLKVRGVLELEEILLGPSGGDPQRYFLAFWGAPLADAPWGWRIMGHHLALHWTLAPDGVAATPFFLGAHPARVDSGPRAGVRVLGAEEDLARELLASLTDEQRRLAVRDDERPGDVVFGPDRDIPMVRPGGIPAAKLTAEQRALLRRLLDEYVGNLREDLAAKEHARIDSRGADAIHFLWIGPTAAGEPCYWRLHGTHFVIEYDVVGPNHVHTLWRDLERDFGADLLAEHRAREHEGR